MRPIELTRTRAYHDVLPRDPVDPINSRPRGSVTVGRVSLIENSTMMQHPSIRDVFARRDTDPLTTSNGYARAHACGRRPRLNSRAIAYRKSRRDTGAIINRPRLVPPCLRENIASP